MKKRKNSVHTLRAVITQQQIISEKTQHLQLLTSSDKIIHVSGDHIVFKNNEITGQIVLPFSKVHWFRIKY